MDLSTRYTHLTGLGVEISKDVFMREEYTTSCDHPANRPGMKFCPECGKTNKLSETELSGFVEKDKMFRGGFHARISDALIGSFHGFDIVTNNTGPKRYFLCLYFSEIDTRFSIKPGGIVQPLDQFVMKIDALQNLVVPFGIPFVLQYFHLPMDYGGDIS